MHIALLGNPNVGKSSVFNRLTGLNQQVGNFAGVTVDKHTGSFKTSAQAAPIQITDLPGIYSLYPNASDERVALQEILNFNRADYPKIFLYVIDITQIERNLLLLTQISDLQLPTIVVLTMTDVASQIGLVCDEALLSKKLCMPVISVNGRTGEGVDLLKKTIAEYSPDGQYIKEKYFDPTKLIATEIINEAQKILPATTPYAALLHLHHAQKLPHLPANIQGSLYSIAEKNNFKSLPYQVTETMRRYEYILPIARSSVQNAAISNKKLSKKASFISYLDAIATHPVGGVGVFFGILFLMFQAVFAWAQPFVDGIEAGFGLLNNFLITYLPAHWLTDLLTQGIVAGLGGIVVFVPQIAILSLIIALLEDTGYMSRAMFVSDGLMRKFGLNGRSIVSLVSGAACAVPAIMATRNIQNRNERLITILVTPFISCSARIPVFAILVGLVVPATSVFGGIVNMRGLVVMGLYLLGVVAALGSAFLLKIVLKTTEQSVFILEMPAYRPPHWKNVLMTVRHKVMAFITEAGKVIMIISMILWFAASYSPADLGNALSLSSSPKNNVEKATALNAEQEAALKLENSFAGHFGKFIEPAIAPIGFDWKIGIALITSFAAREVFVGTMATIYSLAPHKSTDDLSQSLSQRMQNETHWRTGKPVYTRATSFSLLVFYVLAMQCMSTLAVVRRETNSWRWATFQFLYMTAAAYAASWVVYNFFN